jgi:hypothetical protein
MPFVKGQSGNPAGKRKGTKSRTTIQLQQALLRLLDEHIDELSVDLSGLSKKDRVNAVIALVRHLIPAAINPEALTEAQMQMIVEYLENKRNEQAQIEAKN